MITIFLADVPQAYLKNKMELRKNLIIIK